MDNNPDAVTEMPFLPWLDVKSTNPVETVGIIFFFLLSGVILYYLFKKRKEEHIVPHLDTKDLKTKSNNYSYFDDSPLDTSDIHSTHNLPKGIRVTIQRVDYDEQYDATVINITNDDFTIFLNNDPNHKYNPIKGEKTQFIAEINDMRWSFISEFSEVYDEGIRGYNYLHTYDLFITPKRKEARIFRELPALFSIIPRNVVIGPIPIVDLAGKIQGELPSTIRDISASGCAIHTRSPLDFNQGDLAVISFILPDRPEEHTVFAGVNNIKKKHNDDGGGSILNMEFLKINTATDNVIKQLVSSYIEEEIIV